MNEHRITFTSYIFGFLLSLIFTLTAYSVATSSTLTSTFALEAVITLAMLQFIAQLFFFLHLGKESKPRWNIFIFITTFIGICILVFGSLWIMNHLNYNMTSQDMQQFILKDEGISTNQQTDTNTYINSQFGFEFQYPNVFTDVNKEKTFGDELYHYKIVNPAMNFILNIFVVPKGMYNFVFLPTKQQKYCSFYNKTTEIYGGKSADIIATKNCQPLEQDSKLDGFTIYTIVPLSTSTDLVSMMVNSGDTENDQKMMEINKTIFSTLKFIDAKI